MSKLSVTQFDSIARVSSGSLLCPQTPFISTEDVDTSATSSQSSAFAANCRFIRVVSDANLRITFGVDPTATATSMPIRADQPEYFAVAPGLKLAAIEG